MKKTGLLLAVALCASGCGDKKPMMMGPPQKPAPAPEMQKLNWMIGEWEGTAEMVSPSAAEINKSLPEGATPMPDSFKGGGKIEWALGGMFIRSEGWHEMGSGLKATYIEYMTWDPSKKKIRTNFFSDWGEHGGGWATLSDDGKSMTVKAEGSDPAGMKKSGTGTMRSIDANTIEWTWTEKSEMGKMEFKGTSRRKR